MSKLEKAKPYIGWVLIFIVGGLVHTGLLPSEVAVIITGAIGHLLPQPGKKAEQ